MPCIDKTAGTDYCLMSEEFGYRNMFDLFNSKRFKNQKKTLHYLFLKKPI